MAAARAAYLAGFTATSNLAAGPRYGIPTTGTAAHAFTLLHDSEAAAFRAQVAALGTGTTLLVDTYDISDGIATAIEVAGPGLGAIRIDSGDLGVLARQAREQLDRLGAPNTQIVVSGDLDEFAIARCAPNRWTPTASAPRWSTGSGAADRGHGLQAGRGGRAAGGQAQHSQSLPRRSQERAAPVQAQRHRGRGGGVLARKATEARTARPGLAGAADA